MLRASQILVSTCALAAGAVALLAGCGQRGALYLPGEPAAQQRATLPQTLDPMRDTPVPSPIPAPVLAPSPALSVPQASPAAAPSSATPASSPASTTTP